MAFHCAHGNEQSGADLGIAQMLAKGSEDFCLPCGDARLRQYPRPGHAVHCAALGAPACVVDSVAGSVVSTDVRLLPARPGCKCRAGHHLQEDTMHPEIANQLAEFRRAELIAEAAHQPPVREAKQARADRGGQQVGARLASAGRARPGRHRRVSGQLRVMPLGSRRIERDAVSSSHPAASPGVCLRSLDHDPAADARVDARRAGPWCVRGLRQRLAHQ